MRTKYTLIDRGEEYGLTAVSTAVLADMKARGVQLVSERPVTQAEIKKERIHVYQDVHYFEAVAFEDFKAYVEGKRFKATVRWFNPMSGCGGVDVEGGNRWILYACNIVGKRTWYPETACVYFEPGDEIEVEIKPFVSNSLLVCHTPGKFDADKWAGLNPDQLAFKCDEDGNLTSGLFA